MLLTDLPYDCLVKVLEFVPLREQIHCLEVWPQWRGNLLLSHKQLKIRRGFSLKDIDELRQEIVFGETGVGFHTLLDDLYNLEELDVSNVDSEHQQQIVEGIGRERRKLKVIKFGWCNEVNYEVFKRMVDAVPQLEEFRGDFGNANHTNRKVRYLLMRARELDSVDLDFSDELRLDVFEGVRLKVFRAICNTLHTGTLLDHLESSRDTLERLEIPNITYRNIESLVKFKNLKEVSCVRSVDKCIHPTDVATEVARLCCLPHLQEIKIYGCIHDEDIRSISESWKDMRDLQLTHGRSLPHAPSHDALMCVSYLTSIEKMHLSNMKNLTDAHMQVFSKTLVNLRMLQLIETSVTGEGLKQLANLPNIRAIRCFYNYGGVHVFSTNEEIEEVIRVLNAPQRKKGREFQIVTSALHGLLLMV